MHRDESSPRNRFEPICGNESQGCFFERMQEAAGAVEAVGAEFAMPLPFQKEGTEIGTEMLGRLGCGDPMAPAEFDKMSKIRGEISFARQHGKMGTALWRTESRKWPRVKFARHHRAKRMIGRSRLLGQGIARLHPETLRAIDHDHPRCQMNVYQAISDSTTLRHTLPLVGCDNTR